MTSILLALTAILIWSTLALFSSQLTHVSPFLVLGVALMLSGAFSLVRRSAWRIPLTTLAVGVGGIFGYHFLYFSAMALAPAVEASLINYLWPLLIVVLSPLVLAGYRLRPRHIFGALLGLAGAGLIATGGHLSLRFEYLSGYLMMAGAALIWALYSLLTKRVPHFSTESVAAFCTVSGLLALTFYVLNRRNAATGAGALSPRLAGDRAVWSGSDGHGFLLLGCGAQARRPTPDRLAGLPDAPAIHVEPGGFRPAAAHTGFVRCHGADHHRSAGWVERQNRSRFTELSLFVLGIEPSLPQLAQRQQPALEPFPGQLGLFGRFFQDGPGRQVEHFAPHVAPHTAT